MCPKVAKMLIVKTLNGAYFGIFRNSKMIVIQK